MVRKGPLGPSYPNFSWSLSDWFGTMEWILPFHSVGNFISTDEVHHFSAGEGSTTNQLSNERPTLPRTIFVGWRPLDRRANSWFLISQSLSVGRVQLWEEFIGIVTQENRKVKSYQNNDDVPFYLCWGLLYI
jgi:hypothetical protein